MSDGRCLVTGNECGSDTWPLGYCCACIPCLDYVNRQREALGAASAAGGTRGEHPWPPKDPHAAAEYWKSQAEWLRAALAEAEARGRRQGREEAIRLVEGDPSRANKWELAARLRALAGGGGTEEAK